MTNDIPLEEFITRQKKDKLEEKADFEQVDSFIELLQERGYITTGLSGDETVIFPTQQMTSIVQAYKLTGSENAEKLVAEIEEELGEDVSFSDVSKKAERLDEWEFKNILPDTHFISRFIDAAKERTDAYPEYHFCTALNLLSMAVDRHIKIRRTPTSIYPNMWMLLVGKSTVSRKSTSLKIGDIVVDHAGLHEKKLPDDFTPQKLIEILEKKPKAMFWKDEFGQFLADMSRSFQSGIGALLSRLYDCPSYFERSLRSDEFVAEDVYVSMLGACVPKQLARHVSVEDIESGFFPRMAVVWPGRNKERKDIRVPDEEEDEVLEDLGNWLGGIKNTLEQGYRKDNKEIAFTPSEEALDVYNEWCNDFEEFIMDSEQGDDFAAFFGRMSDMVLKIAALIELGSEDVLRAISANSTISRVSEFKQLVDYNCLIRTGLRGGSVLTVLTDFTISSSSVKTAIYYATNMFLPYSRKLLTYVKAYQDEDKIQKIYELAVKNVNDQGRVGHSRLLRYSNIKAKDFTDYVNTLMEAGKLETGEDENGSRYYVPLDPDTSLSLPDVMQPDSVDLSLPEELDIPDESEIEGGGDEMKGSNREVLRVIAEKDNGGEGVEFGEVIDASDLGEDAVKEVIDELLSNGMCYEPRPGRVKRL